MPKQGADMRGVGCGQQVGTEVLGADRVGFFLLKVFALIIAAGRHREAEADDETEEGETGGEEHTKVLAQIFGEISLGSSAEARTNPGGDPEDDDRDEKDGDWVVQWVRHHVTAFTTMRRLFWLENEFFQGSNRIKGSNREGFFDIANRSILGAIRSWFPKSARR